MTSKLIVALDTTLTQRACEWAKAVAAHAVALKIGLEFFHARNFIGAALVADASGGLPILLDLKLHDTPETVSRVLRNLLVQAATLPKPPKLWGVTVHGFGGPQMIIAARKVLNEHGGDVRLLVVTMLSTMDLTSLNAVGLTHGRARQATIMGQTAMNAGAHGLICGGADLNQLNRTVPPKTPLIVPGVRLPGHAAGGHSFAITPREAVRLGASHIVVGRPITDAADPAKAAAEYAADAEVVEKVE